MVAKIKAFIDRTKDVCVKADVCERLVAQKSNWHAMEISRPRAIYD
jgi:hypothetical protein